ncbi:NAD(P)H-binding protein [Nonomuraea sp. NPDC047897]|uniref:NAD(P)H-binding protein n=1 Tax=Nonomuraea sp. NPDC047897 TaxID=3364346 RepID=UPI0037193ED2
MGEFLVTGPAGDAVGDLAGRVGVRIVSRLAEAGLTVRALVSDPSRTRLPPHVETARGDLAAPETLEPALRGVETVFLIWPDRGAAAPTPAVEVIAKHARRIVHLSGGRGPHREIERAIRWTGVPCTFLRPTGYAADTLRWAHQVRRGVVRQPYGTAARSPVHERDVAAVAVHVLTSAGHGGATYTISGPETLTRAEQARIIGETVGHEVRWEEPPARTAREELLAAWGDPAAVDDALAEWASFAGAPERVTDTVQRLLGRRALTFRQWAGEHAADFR